MDQMGLSRAGHSPWRRAFIAQVFLLLILGSTIAAASDDTPAQVPSQTELQTAFTTSANKPWTFKSDSGEQILKLQSRPGEVWDFNRCNALSVEVLRQSSGRAVARLRWMVMSRVGGLYSATTAQVAPSMRPARVSFDPNGESADLIPVGHQRPWDRIAASEVRAIELRAECMYTSESADETVKLQLSAPNLDVNNYTVQAEPRLLDVALAAAPKEYRASALLTFRIDPLPDDPYSPDGAADVRVVLPDGRQVLAWLDQAFSASADGSAQLQAAAQLPVYKAWLPELPAGAKVTIRGAGKQWLFSTADIARTSNRPDAGGTQTRWTVPFEVDPQAQVQWGAAPSVWKLTPHGTWTPAAQAEFQTQKLWRPVPFWNPQWGQFGGALRPDSALAQRFEAMLQAAAAAGQQRPLVVLDGESFEREGVFNWNSHPLKGKLNGPGQILRSEAGIDFCRRWMRYCMARWSCSKAVSALCLTTAVQAPSSPDFHERLADTLRTWPREANVPVYSLHPLTRDPQTIADLDGSANAPGNWRADQRVGAASVRLLPQGGVDSTGCLEVRARDVGLTDLCVLTTYTLPYADWHGTAEDNFTAADALLFDVYVPASAPPDLRVGVHLRDRDGQWFEALLPGLVRPGDWTTYAVDMTGRNLHGLKPAKHDKAWTGYSRQRIKEIGLHVYSTHKDWKSAGIAQPLQARFDQIRAIRYERGEQKLNVLAITPVAQTTGMRLSTPQVEDGKTCHRGDLWERHFKVNRVWPNPFDPRQVEFTAAITTPSGKQVRVQGFFNQFCNRREATPGGDEIVEPLGDEIWTVRYRVIEAGPHSITLEVREGGKYDVTTNSVNGHRVESVNFNSGEVSATLKLPEPAFVASADPRPNAPPFRGFVRVADDRRHFELDDGTFYYPLGPCLRSPSDNRIAYGGQSYTGDRLLEIGRRGTYQYEDYFAQFEKAGMNWARVWMCSWWGALEWRRDWPEYQGVGRYNMLNAWRMDHVFDVAEKHGVKINLCLTNHGQFSSGVDPEWENNPYSVRWGGPLNGPAELFTKAEGKIFHQNKLRYAVARWGHSPALMAWALFSELEWTDEWRRTNGRGTPNIDSWHTEMTRLIKNADPNRHLVTTHYSHPNVGDSTMRLADLDFATNNAYSAFGELGTAAQGRMDAAAALSDFWSGNNRGVTGFKHYGKPALIEEQGRHWEGVRPDGFVNNRREQLEADHHCGLWGSVIQPLSGATGYWWWLHVHFDNRYFEYRAVANFLKGEDLRPQSGESLLEPVFRQLDKPTPELQGRALKSDRRMYAWIYHQSTPLGAKVPEVSGGSLRVTNLRPGKYVIEFWNTYEGKVIGTQSGEVVNTGDPIELNLPPVLRDMAIKVKPK